jgi:hypothetical protein
MPKANRWWEQLPNNASLDDASFGALHQLNDQELQRTEIDLVESDAFARGRS